MFAHTDTKQAPWYVVEADDKRRARLNCIHHLLSAVPYEHVAQPKIALPPQTADASYIRPPMEEQTFVPDRYP
jgi:polyphosphate kinase